VIRCGEGSEAGGGGSNSSSGGGTTAAYVAPVYLLGLTVSGAIAEGKAIVNGTCH